MIATIAVATLPSLRSYGNHSCDRCDCDRCDHMETRLKQHWSNMLCNLFRNGATQLWDKLQKSRALRTEFTIYFFQFTLICLALWLSTFENHSNYKIEWLLLLIVSLQQELNGMIVQEKIVESKHQKKQIAEVCKLFLLLKVLEFCCGILQDWKVLENKWFV